MLREKEKDTVECGYTPILGVISALVSDILPLAEVPEFLSLSKYVIHNLLLSNLTCPMDSS